MFDVAAWPITLHPEGLLTDILMFVALVLNLAAALELLSATAEPWFKKTDDTVQ